jgi:hypothetical protein
LPAAKLKEKMPLKKVFEMVPLSRNFSNFATGKKNLLVPYLHMYHSMLLFMCINVSERRHFQGQLFTEILP